MNTTLPPYKIRQFTKQWRGIKWMNFRILKDHDKCVVTLHMSVFNPEHTLHPPGHAVHMSGIGTTASCQCLIPGWICLTQTHAWMDICAHRLYHTQRSAPIILSRQFPGTDTDASLEALVSLDQLAHVVTQPLPWSCRSLSTFHVRVWHGSVCQ